MTFKLRFDPAEIQDLGNRYLAGNAADATSERQIEDVIGPRSRENSFYTREDFLILCRWKTPRTVKHCESNSEDYVRDVTRIALETANERLRVEVLTTLSGVGWPTASVLLHFGPKDPYPILDYRALWSLSLEPPKAGYQFDFWWKYVQACRELSAQHSVSMRNLDRALWQYSSENPPK